MSPTLLDRSIGDLTLREITQLGRVVQAVTAALETLGPAPAEVEHAGELAGFRP